MEELKQMGSRTIRGRSSKDTRRGNTGVKNSRTQDMLVGEVPERDRSAEGRAEHETLKHIP